MDGVRSGHPGHDGFAAAGRLAALDKFDKVDMVERRSGARFADPRFGDPCVKGF